MGLLDGLMTPEGGLSPMGQGLLGAVASYAANARRGTPINNIGRGGLGGLLAYGQANELQMKQAEEMQQRKLRDMQMEEAGAKLADANAQRDWRNSLPGPEMFASQAALAGGGGPTVANASKIPQVSPTQSLLYGGLKSGAVKVDDYVKAMGPGESPFAKVDPKDFTEESVKRFAQTRNHADLVPVRKAEFVNGTAVDPYNTKPGTVIPQPFNPNEPFNMVGGQVTPNVPFQEFSLRRATASAPKMPAINLSDPTAVARAGMDLQDKVRSAFKDDSVIANQYMAMQKAVKSPSAQGDTALLYSFFKVLDPQSTVREGEIDMVKSSRSIPDRFKGYAQKLANGQLLMPNEREDILTQARRQVDVRRQRSSQDVQAYRENAKRLGLDPELYVPDPYNGADSAKVVVKRGKYGGRNVIQYNDGSIEYAD